VGTYAGEWLISHCTKPLSSEVLPLGEEGNFCKSLRRARFCFRPRLSVGPKNRWRPGTVDVPREGGDHAEPSQPFLRGARHDWPEQQTGGSFRCSILVSVFHNCLGTDLGLKKHMIGP